MKTIEITVSHPYPVHIGHGLLPKVAELIKEIGSPDKIALVADQNVAALYGAKVAKPLLKAGFAVVKYFFPAGEKSKNIQQLSQLLEFLAESRLSRGDLLIALGGGVTGDLAGLAAALYQRGMAYVQMPTTLLAAVDSSVGGKTAVNLSAGKNLAGVFWQPQLVICDCDLLATLPKEELAAGAAECVKYAILSDPELLTQLTEQGLAASWQDIIPACIYQKAEIVSQDEKEQGLRQILNFGHTIGHAVERLSNYSIRHGEAVAMGMIVMTRAAERKGICERGVATRIAAALQSLQLPVACPYAAADLAQAALADKKRHGDSITLVLPRAVGDCFLYQLPTDQLAAFIALGLEEE